MYYDIVKKEEDRVWEHLHWLGYNNKLVHYKKEKRSSSDDENDANDGDADFLNVKHRTFSRVGYLEFNLK